MIAIKRILIDIDNTCAQTDVAMVNFYNELTGKNITYNKDLVTWDLELLIKDWSRQQINDIFIQEGFFKHLKLHDGVVETLNKLKEEGYFLEIVTCHDIRGIVYKCDWINKNLPMVDRINILPLGKDLKLDKSNVQGDIIIDDLPSILETSPCKYKILFSEYDWNRSCKSYPRAKDWNEVYKFIEAIEMFEEDIN
jgi:5'(3')-deoxyribonucleotidase